MLSATISSLPKLSLKAIALGEASRCMALQMSLTKEALSVYGQRTQDKYEKMIKNGIMLGHYNSTGELVSQIGTTLEPKTITRTSGYLRASNPAMQSLLERSAVIEQGAYITREDYRGAGLMSQLEVGLIEHILDLVKKDEILKVKNEKLHRMLSEGKGLLVVSGCSSENPASALTSMKNGSEIIGVVGGIVVNPSEPPLTAYALAKTVIEGRDDRIIYENPELCKAEVRTLLAERKKMEQAESALILELRERNRIALEGTIEVKEKTRLLEEIHRLALTRANPLPVSWVKKVTEMGYLVSKKDGEYGLRKPIR